MATIDCRCMTFKVVDAISECIPAYGLISEMVGYVDNALKLAAKCTVGQAQSGFIILMR